MENGEMKDEKRFMVCFLLQFTFFNLIIPVKREFDNAGTGKSF